MNTNVGSFDRVIRFLLAAVLFSLSLMVYSGSWVGTLLLVAGAVMLATALFGFCGLYNLLGINTQQSPE
jgi:hypothetical protein